MSSSEQQFDPRRRQFIADPHRPLYHFLPPANWMNDPNGAIFWKGRYHLFYQYNPNGGFHGTIHWGHAVSQDLVHWEDLPIALAPDPDGPDRDGCYSGGAFDNDGVPTFIYYGHHTDRPDRQGGNCIATSDDDLLTWQKHLDNPVIPHAGEEAEYRVYDPCCWKEGDTFYALSGSRSKGGGDTAFLFRSKDLKHWEYLREFYQPGKESDCAVPNFFPLGDRHMLLFASHERGTQYYIGDYVDHTFHPRVHGRMAYGGFCRANLSASITMADDQGRRILFGWIDDGRSEEAERASGWAGAMSLPRILSLSDEGTLRLEPAPELRQLRGEQVQFEQVDVAADAEVLLDGAAGTCLEIAAVFEPGDAGAVGVRLRCSADGQEQTLVVCDRSRQCLEVDVSRSSTSADLIHSQAETGPLPLAADEPLELHIFLDRSVVEVFANHRQCLTKRIYPARPDSLGIGLLARRQSAVLRSMDVWQLSPIWPTQ